ncbi:MFS maltose permease [Colletotrichum truncatum]|uniref:MFS maltose permease n=1 Tax=Colletotrichum truncatum TaxID=5467 RepID=A0ACC3ZLL5_COLTU|nr:MFS maltose permease [Colletotrichum truncatum]KAF6783970.1 MFS maltose permease [Colletotrichum truncatum]
MSQEKAVGAGTVPTVSHGNEQGEAITAMQIERQMTVRESFRFWPKAILFSFIISLAIIMEGYDTNLMSNFYVFPAFQKRYGDQVNADGDPIVSARWQTIINNGVQVGSILGLILNGFITEWIGYKKTMVVSMIAMIGAVFIPFFSNGLPMFLAGALIQGIPWGIFQTLAVTYAADICPTALRAYMTSWVNMCWVIGQLISSGMLRGLLKIENQWGYRIPFALQWIWPIPIIIGTLFAPESPWWLVRQGRLDEAKEAVRKLTSPQSGVHFDLDAHVEMMRVTNQFEIEVSSGTHYWDCFRGVDRRRTEISCMVWLTQSFCGVPFMGYGVQFMRNAGLSAENGFTMGLVQNCIGLIGCFIAWYIMTHIGRRTLYLAGLSSMVIILIIIGGLGVPAMSSGTSWAVGALIVVMLFLFQLSVGPSCYTLVAEMPSTRLRVKTVALARAIYNTGGFVVNALQPNIIGENEWNWGAKGGFFWAGVAMLFLIWTFFRLPEPFGLTYSEIDLLFEHRVGARHFSQEAADSLRPQLEEVANRREKLATVVSHQEA